MQVSGPTEKCVFIDPQNEQPFHLFRGEDIYETLKFFEKIVELSKTDTWLPGDLYVQEVEKIKAVIQRLEAEKSKLDEDKTSAKEKFNVLEQDYIILEALTKAEAHSLSNAKSTKPKHLKATKGGDENFSGEKELPMVFHKTIPCTQSNSKKNSLETPVFETDLLLEGKPHLRKMNMEDFKYIVSHPLYRNKLYTSFIEQLSLLDNNPEFQKKDIPALSFTPTEYTFCDQKYAFFSFKQISSQNRVEKVCSFWESVIASGATCVIALGSQMVNRKMIFPPYWDGSYLNDLIIDNDWIVSPVEADTHGTTITMVDGSTINPKLERRTFSAISLSTGEERRIVQFHFLNWKDGEIAPSNNLYYFLLKQLLNAQNINTQPIFVQAEDDSLEKSLRANAFIALNTIFFELAQQQKSGVRFEECSVNILELLLKLRTQFSKDVFTQFFEVLIKFSKYVKTV